MRRSHLLEYEWNEAAGRQGFEQALRLCDELAKHPSGRLSGVIAPAQIDTCTEDLLRDSVAAARERGLPFTVHCAQAVAEFQEMVRDLSVDPGVAAGAPAPEPAATGAKGPAGGRRGKRCSRARQRARPERCRPGPGRSGRSRTRRRRVAQSERPRCGAWSWRAARPC